jgi:hypothetical protein
MDRTTLDLQIGARVYLGWRDRGSSLRSPAANDTLTGLSGSLR